MGTTSTDATRVVRTSNPPHSTLFSLSLRCCINAFHKQKTHTYTSVISYVIPKMRQTGRYRFQSVVWTLATPIGSRSAANRNPFWSSVDRALHHVIPIILNGSSCSTLGGGCVSGFAGLDWTTGLQYICCCFVSVMSAAKESMHTLSNL